MINLFQFQEKAASNIADKFSEYLDSPATITKNKKTHVVPFFHALSSITGSGKTVILASAVAQIATLMPVKPIVMWLSKGKVVVSQTSTNLSPGGKYHHLLGKVETYSLADFSLAHLSNSNESIIYFATVGTFNQKDKVKSSLKIHQSDVDQLGGTSIWSALKVRVDNNGIKRPLIVVYDEAQNLSDQQTEMLLELEPDGFLLASATMRIPELLGKEIEYLKTAGVDEKSLVTKVDSGDVVAAGLIKNTVHLEGDLASMEATIDEMVRKLDLAGAEAKSLNLNFSPKAIYVCNTNVVSDTPNQIESPKQPFNDRKAPPILIWKYLTEELNISPSEIAVYSDLKVDKDYPLPDEFILFRGGDRDYDDFVKGNYKHIIFNLTLQEGWDDPSVYFAYIDKSMGSKAQVTQVIGRVLRQPEAKHYPSEMMNTAHFYVRVDKNIVFSEVVEEVQNELGNTSTGIRITVKKPGRPSPELLEAGQTIVVPETALDPTSCLSRIQNVFAQFPDYRADKVNTIGTGSRRILKKRIDGNSDLTEWENYSTSSQATARWILHRELARKFKHVVNIVNLADSRLDALVGIGSPAYQQICKFADDLVQEYISFVKIVQRKSNPYQVGAIFVNNDDEIQYNNAVHSKYSGLNGPEKRFAQAIDLTGLTWCRNPAKSGYGIPLISVGPTSYFYPDFLIWTDERVICLDTKGEHLIRDAAARKLFNIKNSDPNAKNIDIQYVSEGKIDKDFQMQDSDGYTLWTIRPDGEFAVTHFDEIDFLVQNLIDDSLHR